MCFSERGDGSSMPNVVLVEENAQLPVPVPSPGVSAGTSHVKLKPVQSCELLSCFHEWLFYTGISASYGTACEEQAYGMTTVVFAGEWTD